jgi:hypothetical protein
MPPDPPEDQAYGQLTRHRPRDPRVVTILAAGTRLPSTIFGALADAILLSHAEQKTFQWPPSAVDTYSAPSSGEASGSHLLVMGPRRETARPHRANAVRLPRTSDTNGNPRRAELRPVARGDSDRHGWLQIVVAVAT